MVHQGNDLWTAGFMASSRSGYTFTIRAWVDQLETWFDGFKKKAAAKVDVHVELMEGVLLLNQLPDRKSDKIQAIIRKLGNKESHRHSFKPRIQ